jgi:hypothetical protein
MAFRSSAISSSAVGGDITSSPAGVQSGDYLVGLGVADRNDNPPTGLTGWTELANIDQAAPDAQTARIMWKISDGADDFTASFESSNCYWVVGAWTGRNTVSPHTDSQTTVSTASNATPISASLTGVTAVNGDDIAVFLELDQLASADWNFSTITDYTERKDDTTLSFVTVGLQTRDNVSAGATGSLATTVTRTAGTGNSGYAGIVIAIAQAPGTPITGLRPAICL